MRLGSSTPATYYLGSTEVVRLYLGSSLVFGPALAVNPTSLTLDFVDPGGGAEQELRLGYVYTIPPADTLIATLAFRNGGSALTVAQLQAGTGTFVNRQQVSPVVGTALPITPFANPETITAVDLILEEINNGGVSAVVTETITGLTFPATAILHSITYDAAGAIIDYTGTLSITYDAAGAILEVT